MKIVTMNSVYEVDEEKKLVRRAENTKHVYDHRLASEDWQPYSELNATAHGGYIFSLPGGSWVLTSPVQEIIQ